MKGGSEAARGPSAGREASRWKAAYDSAIRDTSRFARLLAVLSEPGPQDRMLGQALATLSELFAADIAVLVDPVGTGSFVPLASIGLPEGMERGPLSDAEGGYLASALSGQAPILTVKAGTDADVDPQLRELGAQTVLWLPVTGSRSARGVLLLARCLPIPFSRADVDLLSTMTHRLGLALEWIQKDAQIARLERYGRDVGCRLDASAVVSEAARVFSAVLGAETAALVLAGADGGHGMASRWGPGSMEGGPWCRLADRLASDAAAADPLVTTDAREVLARHGMEQPPDFPVRSFLAVAVRHGGRTLGYLFALRSAAVAFPPDSREAAMLFAGMTAAALENARLFDAARGEIAERKRLEEERVRLEIELRQAQRLEAIGTFAGGIAHDYNNLHLAVIGNLESAREEMERNSEPYRAVDNALRAVLQASELTRRFITFTEGGAPITESVLLSGLIGEAIDQAMAGSNARVECRIPGDLWEPEVDRFQVKQALCAILVNAREAMPGGGLISVTAENVETRPAAESYGTDSARGFVMVAVRDRGTGIRREDLPRIFDPYYSTKERGDVKGMGLGLTIAHSVVRRHGGRIEVESEVGTGSTFRVYLPAPPKRRRETAMPHPGSAGRVRLLLLEDEQIVADATVRMLRRLGFEDVEHALEGADALERFQRARREGAPFCLVILDLVIRGGMGGKETMRRLLEIDPDLTAIVCSGYSDDPVMSNHREYGFRCALPKPFRMQDLARAIQMALAS